MGSVYASGEFHRTACGTWTVTGSYPRVIMRSPHAFSICSTPFTGREVRQPPALATDRMRELEKLEADRRKFLLSPRV